MRLVAPGPDVAIITPTLPVAWAYPDAICPAPCSCRGEHVSDRAVEDRVVRRQDRSARHPKHDLDTFVFECSNEGLGSRELIHSWLAPGVCLEAILFCGPSRPTKNPPLAEGRARAFDACLRR